MSSARLLVDAVDKLGKIMIYMCIIFVLSIINSYLLLFFQNKTLGMGAEQNLMSAASAQIEDAAN